MTDPNRKIRFLSPEDLKFSRAFFELSLPRVFPWFLYGVGLLLLIAGLWATFGKMEIVVKAFVVLRPRQNVSELKSALTGQVTSRLFTPGQQVKAGEVLWILDDRQVIAQKDGAQGQKKRAEKILADVKMVLQSLNDENDSLFQNHKDAARKYELIKQEESRLNMLWEQAQRDWDLEKTLPKAAQASSRTKDLETSALMAKGQLDSYLLNQKQNLLDQENSLKSEIENLISQLASLDEQLSNSQVRAPLSGWVEEVRKFNSGDVVLAGETLVRIIPESVQDLKAQLSVASNDIAEIKVGMPFRMVFPKLHPSEFGQLEGTLESVPQDAWLQPDAPPVFQLEGSLSRLWMENNQGLRINLKAGMTADARIIIKKKPIWRFVLEKLDFIK